MKPAKRHIRRGAAALAVICAVISFLSCNRKEETVPITPQKRDTTPVKERKNPENSLRVAVGGMITPREGFVYYGRLLHYIEKKTGRHVDFVDRRDYAEINQLIESGDVDMAFVCGGPYVEGRRRGVMELLAAPVVHGAPVYHSYIIVHRDSGIRTVEGLRGKSFAFTDPLSNSGYTVPAYLLAQMDETPGSFFGNITFTYAHDQSIEAVAEGIVDGAAVDSLIWEYLNLRNPELTSMTRIIYRSRAFGIPPVVVRRDLPPHLKRELRNILLHAHEDGEGQKILAGMMIDKFIEIDDSAYDSIREMKRWLTGNGSG